MFERLRSALLPRPSAVAGDDPVAHWARGLFLRHHATGPHGFELSGRLHDRAFQAECHPSSRPYIEGLELRARVDLGLPPAGHVIVMSNAVRGKLQALAGQLQPHTADAQQAGSPDGPEEIHWLSSYPSVRWSGGDPRFWSHYTVLSDSVELARRWVDTTAIEYLMTGDGQAASHVPLLVVLRRGRCFLRLQVNPHAQGADALLALELLDHLCEVALQLATRSGALEDPLNNPE